MAFTIHVRPCYSCASAEKAFRESGERELKFSAPRERGSPTCSAARGRRMLENACAKKRRFDPLRGQRRNFRNLNARDRETNQRRMGCMIVTSGDNHRHSALSGWLSKHGHGRNTQFFPTLSRYALLRQPSAIRTGCSNERTSA